MRIISAKDYADMSRKAAALIAAQVVLRPNSVLGLATGSTPVGAYERLVELYKAGDLSFSGVTTINLDEYVGLAPDNGQSYRYFMDNQLFNHIDVDKANTHVPNGTAPDLDGECERYEALIGRVGIDLQILGLGLNGHIGFNEPRDEFEKLTRVVDLDETTIEANARFFADPAEVPRKAITMGIKTIMSAKKLVLMASGAAKRDILLKSIRGPITPRIPASVLQLHPDLTVISDIIS